MDESTCNVDEYGDKRWTFSNGELHCVNGPAVEFADGDKFWYIHDKLHRVDGPAIEYTNGDKEWYIHGEHHRVDGPAVEYTNGSKAYWHMGKQIDENKYYSKEFQVQMVMES